MRTLKLYVHSDEDTRKAANEKFASLVWNGQKVFKNKTTGSVNCRICGFFLIIDIWDFEIIPKKKRTLGIG